MNIADIFYLIFIGTLVGVRIGIYLLPKAKVRVYERAIHHFWIGVFLVLASLVHLFLIGWRWYWIILAGGIALIGDELVYMFLGEKPFEGGRWRSKTYWSAASVIGAITSCIVVFLFREWFVSLL